MDGRYVIPSFAERTSDGIVAKNPYDKLFTERIVFIGTEIDDMCANDVIAQLLALEGLDPDSAISLYLNSPGGSLTALMAIYDTMCFIRPPIETTCLGQAASAAAVLLAAGASGRRAALPNSRIVLHQPHTGGAHTTSSDIQIQAAEIQRLRDQMEAILARHTGRTADQVRDDLERDRYLTAEEALAYGVIDEIITSRKRQPAAAAA